MQAEVSESQKGIGSSSSRQPPPSLLPANGGSTPRRRDSGSKRTGSGSSSGGGGIGDTIRDKERRGGGGEGGCPSSSLSAGRSSRQSAAPVQHRRSSSHDDLSMEEAGRGKSGGSVRTGGSGGSGGGRDRSGSLSSETRRQQRQSGQHRSSRSTDRDPLSRSGRRRRRLKGEGSGELDHPAARRTNSGESAKSSLSGGSGAAVNETQDRFPGVRFDPRNDDDGLVRNISLVRDTSTSVSSNGTQERTVTVMLKTGRNASMKSGGLGAATSPTAGATLPSGQDSAGSLLQAPGGIRNRGGDRASMFSLGGSGSTMLVSNAAALSATLERGASISSRGGSSGTAPGAGSLARGSSTGERGGTAPPTPRSTSSRGSSGEAELQSSAQAASASAQTNSVNYAQHSRYAGASSDSAEVTSGFPSEVVDLSTRSAPPLQLLHRDTTMTTVCSERTTSGDEDLAGDDNRRGSGGPDGLGHSVEIDVELDAGEDFDPLSSTRTDSDNMVKRRKVNLLVDQCESARFPFKKKLILANMNLTVSDIPVDDVCSHVLSHSLHKLSLAGNRLSHVPDKIVMKLSGLRTLDLSQCDLRSLPRRWNLPHLKRLDVSHNRIESFPSESMCEGLPELQVLDMYGNKVAEIIVPRDLRLLARLDHLNLGYNRIRRIPSDLDRLTSLRTLRIMNNVLEKVPERVCEMDLRVIDVSANPLVQPPVETCERGIGSMRRYYHCLRLEEKSRQKMIDEMHRKAEMKKKSRLACRKEKWRKVSTPLLSLTMKRPKPSRISDSAFALGGDTEHDDSLSSDATQHQLPPSSLGPADRAKSEPVAKPVTSEKPAAHASRTKSTPTPPISTPKLAAAEQSPVPTSAKRILATAPSAGAAAATAEKADTSPRNELVPAALASTPPVKGLSPDLPMEKRILEPAGTAIRVHKPFDGDARSDERAELSSKPPPSSAVPISVEVPAVAAKSSAESLGQSNLHSSAPSIGSEEYEAQLDAELEAAEDELVRDLAVDTVNDTLKVIFVGMACAGKTSMIKRLIEGRDAKIPKQEERTVGVDIYEWDPKHDGNDDRDHVDTRIVDSAGGRGFGSVYDDEASYSDDVDVKFSVWDFAGQHVYHATHELFFSPRALYVLVWDMGVSNVDTQRRNREREEEQGAFKLSYDSSDDEDDELGNYPSVDDNEIRRADRALERDIDEKVQFWVDCIQSSAPGAAILPVASFDDFFEGNGDGGLGADEAQRRCDMLKQRLLKHEQRRVRGLQQRLAEYEQGHRANSEAAKRLRHLLCPFSRPKLIFGENSHDSVARVSCTKYRGFDRLAEKIVNISTGRERGGFAYPIFRGHVGARIPRMRLEVREVVRSMRDRFKVVEWGYFLDTLWERGLDNAEDVSDALHFLTNIGELSYFGDVVRDSKFGEICDVDREKDDDEDEDYEEEEAVFVMDKDNSGVGSKGINEIMNDSGPTKAQDVLMSYGLSQFIFLNPRWLVAAVACILRHDLTREINETRRLFNKEALVGWDSGILRSGDDFYAAHLNCPVITAEDACMLWQAKKITKKAAERAQEYSNNMTMTPFEFLQRLLIRFRVFVPIDLSIDKALLGGKEYGLSGENPQSEGRLLDNASMTEVEESPQFFFLPSLLGPGEPAEAWTYKNSDSWKTTLCHSILFPDGVPPGLMERITATVLSDVYGSTKDQAQPDTANHMTMAPCSPSTNNESCQLHTPVGGRLRVKEILCWRSAFFLKMGMENVDNESGEVRESVVEMFCALVDRESHLCVGSDAMGVGMRRLIFSGKGQVGEGGRKIWQGGYTLVIKAVGRVMEEYGGLEFEKQGICPECLAKRPVGMASAWDWTLIRSAARKGDEAIRCQFGHRVQTRLVTGLSAKKTVPRRASLDAPAALTSGDSAVPVSELLRGVVVVGLWDGKTEKIVRVGSGFVVDRKRGLVVTASHTLMNIWGDSKSPYGENYYGLRSGKVVIGVIPRERSINSPDNTTAVFRYFAQIVAKDESIESNGVCHMDACVLQITTKMEQDVGGDGDGCGSQPEILIQNNSAAFKKEKLCQLKVASKECELDEQVRIMGYNQGGEGLIEPGSHVNRCADFAKGYVCMKFHTDVEEGWSKSRRFKPTEEVVVICPTIGGHSGGPCVNQSGEVIGILSRADPTEKQRCYLVPATAWKRLVKKAKNSVVSAF